MGVERKEARDTIIFASDREKLHFPETARVKDDEIDWREKRERERKKQQEEGSLMKLGFQGRLQRPQTSLKFPVDLSPMNSHGDDDSRRGRERDGNHA